MESSAQEAAELATKLKKSIRQTTQQQKQQRAEEQRLPLTCTRSSNLGDLRGQPARVITQIFEGSDDDQGYSPPRRLH